MGLGLFQLWGSRNTKGGWNNSDHTDDPWLVCSTLKLTNNLLLHYYSWSSQYLYEANVVRMILEMGNLFTEKWVSNPELCSWWIVELRPKHPFPGNTGPVNRRQSRVFLWSYHPFWRDSKMKTLQKTQSNPLLEFSAQLWNMRSRTSVVLRQKAIISRVKSTLEGVPIPF